ncbi:pyridoxal phosphate-dependent transferase, partial [Xylogone sp. PMI_703]
MTGAAVSAQYMSGRAGQGPTIPGNHALPTPNAYRSPFRHPDGSYDWKTELDYGWTLIDRASVGSLAAVIMEPILSSGGMITLPDGYLTAMKKHCRDRGMLLIIDEAQTGLGRCGDMFGFQQDPDMVPDIVTLSKTLGNGMALSAVVTSDELADQAKAKGFLFYTTHVNDPLPAAVGLKVLEIVLRDGLVERSRRSGELLKNGFKKLMEKYACIGDVRGRGLMIGVEIVKDRRLEGAAGKEPNVELGQILCDKMLDMGLSANLMGSAKFGGIFRIAPPIITEEKEILRGLEIFERAFQETEGTLFL